jgi:hypothetical protein
MLTNNDLHREEELSSSSMGAVVGGMSRQSAETVASVYLLTASILNALGDQHNADCFTNYGNGMIAGAS